MALDSLALQTDGLEVGVGGGIGGLGCRYRADGCFSQRFCFYYFAEDSGSWHLHTPVAACMFAGWCF